jgi:phospholipase/carboxylesterase
MNGSIVIQQPDGAAEALVLLFHGVGASAQDMAPLGWRLAQARPRAMVVSVNAPHPSDLGRGFQWFSVIGVTEENRPVRVMRAMPDFAAAVAHWQKTAGVGVAATSLVGFSQGAIMALESTQAASPLAGRVVAIAGRFAQPPRLAPAGVDLHLVHGDRDPVIPAKHMADGAERLAQLGAALTRDLLPGLGHGIDARVAQCVVERLGQA